MKFIMIGMFFRLIMTLVGTLTFFVFIEFIVLVHFILMKELP